MRSHHVSYLTVFVVVVCLFFLFLLLSLALFVRHKLD